MLIEEDKLCPLFFPQGGFHPLRQLPQNPYYLGMTFEKLHTRWPWRPIRHCPGRYVLPRQKEPLPFEILLGRPCSPQVCSSPGAKDPVLICPLQDGGVISYQQSDGHLIHTLNTATGFRRKLDQLGLSLSENRP